MARMSGKRLVTLPSGLALPRAPRVTPITLDVMQESCCRPANGGGAYRVWHSPWRRQHMSMAHHTLPHFGLSMLAVACVLPQNDTHERSGQERPKVREAHRSATPEVEGKELCVHTSSHIWTAACLLVTQEQGTRGHPRDTIQPSLEGVGATRSCGNLQWCGGNS